MICANSVRSSHVQVNGFVIENQELLGNIITAIYVEYPKTTQRDINQKRNKTKNTDGCYTHRIPQTKWFCPSIDCKQTILCLCPRL